MDIEYRRLARDEVDLLRKIDRSELIEKIYYYRDGQLVLEDERHEVSNEWFQTKNVEPKILPGLLKLHDEGGVVFGAFADGQFVGIAALDPKFYTENRLNLDIIFVSRQFRGKGIARHLMGLVAEEARKRGASKLYVSATPSEHTVKFYMDLGCKLVSNPDPVLLKKEPEDIHMELEL